MKRKEPFKINFQLIWAKNFRTQLKKTNSNSLPVASCIHCPEIALNFPVNPCFGALLRSLGELYPLWLCLIICHSSFLWATVANRHYLSLTPPKNDSSWNGIYLRQKKREHHLNNLLIHFRIRSSTRPRSRTVNSNCQCQKRFIIFGGSSKNADICKTKACALVVKVTAAWRMQHIC